MMRNATSNPAEYDYAIVGSGAGGGPLAGNLARAGQKVLLLEAGGAYEGYNYQVPAFHAHATEDPRLCWNYFVRHYADDEQQRRDPKFTLEHDGVLYPRSGTLGGCTAHNAMITVYPHNSDWDEIARMTGDPSWHSDVMRRYFERLERCQYIQKPWPYPRNRVLAALLRAIPWLSSRFSNPSRHGFHGWLTTNIAPPVTIVKDLELLQVIAAAAEATLAEDLGRPLTSLERLTSLESLAGYFDPNAWFVQMHNLQGLWFTPMTTNQGKRTGAREYIRRVQKSFPDDLTVKTNALVTKVLFNDDNRAIGLEYREGKHLYQADSHAERGNTYAPVKQVFVKKEVILSAGAFNTPQLLKLSGIGPREELTRFGIKVRVDLPGVGENLQDRYEIGVVHEMVTDFSLLRDLTFEEPLPGQKPDPSFREWQAGKGLYTTNGVAIGMIKKSQQEQAVPDLYIFGLPSSFQGYFPSYAEELEISHNYFTWAILKAHTRNTAGRVTLRSSDPCDVPAINFHYFQEGNDHAEEDLQAVVNGVEFVRKMMQHARHVVHREVLPGATVTTQEELRQFIKNEAWGHHASCTCKMGVQEDPLAVVDSQFRVFGTKSLRVVDASVFPRIPGFFIASAIYMISEKASDVILADALNIEISPAAYREEEHRSLLLAHDN